MARLLRDALVDTPQRMGWRKTLAIRLVLLTLVGAVALAVTDLPVVPTLLAVAVSAGAVWLAGGVWQWRIRVRRRKAVSR